MKTLQQDKIPGMLRQTWVNYMAYSAHHAGYRFFYSLARVCFMKCFMANPDELCSDKANGQNLCSAEDCSMLSRVFTPAYACFKDLYRPLSLCVRQSASSHQYVAIATRSSMELLKKKTNPASLISLCCFIITVKCPGRRQNK